MMGKSAGKISWFNGYVFFSLSVSGGWSQVLDHDGDTKGKKTREGDRSKVETSLC